ncbi:MAG TPA: helix-turn-helix domain-containing protein [Roseiflexaceae bacterium]|nr:helix-turn-helix domain-containing protein [Roseiflexaceae bacterium]
MPHHWTFLTNHAQVLLAIAARPQITAREIAARVGITERQVQHIVVDLEADGYLTKAREGRTNVYAVNREQPMRHAAQAGRTVGDLLRALERGASAALAEAGDERSTGA